MTDQENQELPEEGPADTLVDLTVEGDLIEPSEDAISELEIAQIEISKLKDAFLRAKAEEDNVRRRAEKEIANGRKFAVEGFAKEMVNVFDSLKLAAAVQISD
ncbi:MAG: molecular chaperone GrpE, partial [Arenicella sp.]